MPGPKRPLKAPAALSAPAVAPSRLLLGTAPTEPQPLPCRAAALASKAELPLPPLRTPPGRYQEQGATLLQLSTDIWR